MNKAIIHPTAIVHSNATIEAGVTIGPYSIIGCVYIGKNSIIHPHVIVSDNVKLGSEVEIFPGAFIGKEPKGAGATSKQPEFNNSIIIGDYCSIGPNTVIYFDVEIGRNTLIGDGASIREQCRIGEFCIISRYVTLNYNAHIGNRTKIMDGTHITGNCKIGSDVFISTMVGTTNDNAIRGGFGDHIVGPTIQDGAIVGVGASLLPSVIIGNGSTVGAGSVVTKNVPSSVTVFGVPARPVERNKPVEKE